jgi:hypothetical protein
MARNDITLGESVSSVSVPSRTCNVAAGATQILPGEPVVRALGAPTVTAMPTGAPVVGTNFVVGIATSVSTQTALVAGSVDVMPLVDGASYFANPTVAATWDTQAEYDALVGDRVVMTLASGKYTIDAVDGATNGFVVEALNITAPGNKGKVKFTVRASANVNA